MPATITVASAREDAGSSHLSALAEREMIRRQQAVTEADRLLAEGRVAYGKRDYQQAFDKFKEALSKLPDAPMLADRHAAITSHLADASVALAQQFRRQGGDAKKGDKGTYDDARALLDVVLKEDPENAAAKRELGYLDDPIRTNPALTYKHTQDIDKVRRGLYTAEGFYNLGKYDEAKREYEKVLRIDPYNTAARRGMEVISAAKTAYYRAAYDQTRAELLSEVDKAWELSIPAEGPIGDVVGAGRPTVSSGIAYINEKLRRIIIPNIAFDDITVDEAVDFLRQRAAELDVLELDPARKGVNFLIRKPQGAAGGDAGTEPVQPGALVAGSPGALRIKSLRLTNIPLGQALKYICDATNLRSKVDEYAVTLVPRTETGNEMFTRTFRVPPGFYDMLAAGGEPGAAAGPIDPFDKTAGKGEGRHIEGRPPIVELLKKIATFGEGSSATLSPGGLMVINTGAELDKIEGYVEGLVGQQPKQIKITSKFVEVTQENTDELSFDWLVTPFGLNSAGTLFGSGGTIGSGQARTGNDFVNPVNGVSIPGIPSNPALPVQNISTADLRSGSGAISGDSIDSLLNNPLRTSSQAQPAPGIAALTGLFSGGQVQMIMRGLAQKKGTDLMTAPSVTAKPGQKATIEIIREFIYATEYEPPQLPQQNNNNNNILGGNRGGGGGFATPSTPSAWETRNTGVTLEIEPTIAENNYVIDLRFVPEIVEFEGFINYGSPILSPSTDVFGNPTTVVITDNRIEMPVFSTRRVNTSLSIYDGYTVAVGGLIREDVQNVQDSVPIFGSIPIIGRLFQSKAENHLKSNLIIFVTAQIIDATGRPLRGNEATTTPPPTPEAPGGAPEVLPQP